jgi:hypothetical protein
MPVDRVQTIMKMAQQPISLQNPVRDGEDSSFGNFIEDNSAENPYDMTAFSLLSEKLGSVLGSLTEREREVLVLCFGLKDGYSRTLEEVGQMLFEINCEDYDYIYTFGTRICSIGAYDYDYVSLIVSEYVRNRGPIIFNVVSYPVKAGFVEKKIGITIMVVMEENFPV